MKFDKEKMRLYAITDRHWLNGRSLKEVVKESLDGGVTFLQLRDKNSDDETFLQEAAELQELCRDYKVPLIINDNVEIALKMNADGVHVGQSDMEAGAVREKLGPNKILGVSARTVEQALLAQERGADYLGVGAVFATGSKADAAELPHETLKAICEAVSIPVVAIGGITAENISQLKGTGICGTQKYLFRLSDGNVIESVLMRYKHGNSVCISSQVGCRMGCRFCASTIGGLTRCLLPSEMLDQIYRIQALTGERVSNVVVMGTGEPLDNYENLLRFIHILTEDGGLHISQRNLTVSTCGLVPKIYDLAKEKLQMTLALSLHAPNDVKRRELMPIANKYSMDEVLEACRYYFKETGRRITFEYSLVAGVNDSDEDARELSGRIRDMNCHVNLIPVNPIKERSFVRSTRQAVENFKIKLEKC